MDPTLPRTLQIIGDEWRDRRRELAEWAMERLVNRHDVWGQYTTPSARELREGGKTYKALTLPQKSMRGKDMVTLEKLSRHFGGLRRHHLIGLHAASTDNTSKWMAIDIDLHDPDAVEAEDGARRNLAAALGWLEVLQARGYDPLLLDSNGAGGLHMLVVFAEPAPSEDVYALAQETVADWERRNLDAKPETFPKSARPVEGDKLGAWLRLPGLHHTRDHLTRVWSGDDWLDDPWQEGAAMVDALLGVGLAPPPPKAVADKSGTKKKAVVRKKAAAKKKGAWRRKREVTVCVDLDGVLAHYDGWAGEGVIGEPIGGAVEFTRRLADFAQVAVYTSRMHAQEGEKQVETEAVLRAWLDEHGFAYDSVYGGIGKPMANAYIDDRAVSCLPQDFGPGAYLAAEARARSLCGKRSRAGVDREFGELADLWPGLTAKQRKELLKLARGE